MDEKTHTPLESVFLGWATDPSHFVARALKHWLPALCPGLKTWLSSEDLRPGARWSNELLSVLKQVDAGILCLAPSNIDSPWLHFEAGALLRAVGSERIIPYAIGVKLGDIKPPIGEFQAASADRHGTFNLVRTLRGGIPPERNLFNVFWPLLYVVLTEVQAGQSSPDGLIEDLKRASTAKMSARLEKVTLSTQNISPGSTIDLNYFVDVDADASGVEVWLGASIRTDDAKFFYNPQQDTAVVLRAGRQRYSRKLTISTEMPAGPYRISAEVWLGPISNSENSFPIAKLWPVHETLTVL